MFLHSGSRSSSQISSSATTNLGRPPTFQIQKFLNTTPGSEPFALLVAGPESDRQSRIKGYIAQFETAFSSSNRTY